MLKKRTDLPLLVKVLLVMRMLVCLPAVCVASMATGRFLRPVVPEPPRLLTKVLASMVTLVSRLPAMPSRRYRMPRPPLMPALLLFWRNVVLDQCGVGGAVVRQEHAGDVVLENVVDDVRAEDVGGDRDARAIHSRFAGFALDGKAVERHVMALMRKEKPMPADPDALVTMDSPAVERPARSTPWPWRP